MPNANRNRADSTNGDKGVQRAFQLGWRFAQLYHGAYEATEPSSVTPNGDPPDRLPPLSNQNLTWLTLQSVERDLRRLDTDYNEATGTGLSFANLRARMTEKGQNGRARRVSLGNTFSELSVSIGSIDPRYTQAIDLGRMLADITQQSNYRQELKWDSLKNAYAHLQELHASFPRHASDAVRESLEYWEGWVIKQEKQERSRADTACDDTAVCDTLSRQGERWRRLLSGEMLAGDLLAAKDYGQAVGNYFARMGGLTWRFLTHYKPFWPVGVLAACAGGAIIWAILSHIGTAPMVALIAAAAGSLGISWRTIGSTLGKIAAKAEDYLWDAEIREAIVEATFIPPAGIKRKAIVALRREIQQQKDSGDWHRVQGWSSSSLPAANGADAPKAITGSPAPAEQAPA
jgi:hypothetical protein